MLLSKMIAAASHAVEFSPKLQRSDQIILHLFQPHQADQVLTLLKSVGSPNRDMCS